MKLTDVFKALSIGAQVIALIELAAGEDAPLPVDWTLTYRGKRANLTGELTVEDVD